MNTTKLQEKEWLQNVLVQQKQLASIYAISAVEAACQTWKEQCLRFFQETVLEQGDNFSLLRRVGQYTVPENATRRAIDQTIQQHQRTHDQEPNREEVYYGVYAQIR